MARGPALLAAPAWEASLAGARGAASKRSLPRLSSPRHQRGMPFIFIHSFFMTLRIIWWISNLVICCSCSVRCVSDSHGRKPLFPFCQYLSICLAQESADEDFLFVLSHCWSDKYTSALSSERKETSCPELRRKYVELPPKGPVITQLLWKHETEQHKLWQRHDFHIKNVPPRAQAWAVCL